MSERTPQDVLRELRLARLRDVDWWEARLSERNGSNRGMAEFIVATFDKAIAEALDSPPEWPTREEVRQARLDLKEGRAKPLRVPDTLSEKPGLDAMTELEAFARNHAALKVGKGNLGDILGFIAWFQNAGSGSTDSEGR